MVAYGIKRHTLALMLIFALMLFFKSTVYAKSDEIVKSVLKIKTYSQNADGYVFESFGSAITLSQNRILTNAHVILGNENRPTGLYEICFSYVFEKVPVCNAHAKLIAYDTVADLALLEVEGYSQFSPVVFASGGLQLGSYVSMYGYPLIGGETITRTDGKIAGYERGMYKIDGNIDHGNSGGGAFNGSGLLIGIPTGVASDNASLGYMIPYATIQKFLAQKTSYYEGYHHIVPSEFITFLRRNQSQRFGSLLYSLGHVRLSTLRSFGFSLQSSFIGVKDTMIRFRFADIYNRIRVTFSCTDDVAHQLGWEIRRDGFFYEKKLYPDWEMFAFDEMNFFTVTTTRKGYDKNIVLYYKKYDACYAEIEAPDTKKDNRVVDQILAFLKQHTRFTSQYVLQKLTVNPFFSHQNLPPSLRIVRSINAFGVIDTILGINIRQGLWVHSQISHTEAGSIVDLFDKIGIAVPEKMKSVDYIASIVKSNASAEVHHILLNSGKSSGIFIIRRDRDTQLTHIDFQYFYQTDSDKYAYWSWSGDVPVYMTDSEIGEVQKLLQVLVYPGKGIFFDI